MSEPVQVPLFAERGGVAVPFEEVFRAPSSGKCPCCKQRIRPLNAHRMDKQKWEVLVALAEFAAEGHEWVKVGHGKTLSAGAKSVSTSYRAEAHVGRLKWFGLVDHKGHRTGLYKISDDGRAFLAGRLRVPEVIFCRDGEVEERSSELVSVGQVKGVVLDKAYWDTYAEEKKHAGNRSRSSGVGA